MTIYGIVPVSAKKAAIYNASSKPKKIATKVVRIEWTNKFKSVPSTTIA